MSDKLYLPKKVVALAVERGAHTDCISLGRFTGETVDGCADLVFSALDTFYGELDFYEIAGAVAHDFERGE